MGTRPYGRTGERATVIGLGGGSLNQRSHADGVATEAGPLPSDLHQAIENLASE